MKVALVGTTYIVLCLSMAVGIVFGKPPLEFYYAQWAEKWSLAERLCQCAGC